MSTTTAPLARTPAISVALLLLLALLTALDAMAIDMYLPGMPAIAQDFGISSGRIQQTLAVFLVGLAVGQGIYGPLLDSHGRRVPLLVGIVLFVIGSVMAALAPDIQWLMAARFLQALGAAAGLVTPRAIVADRCTVTEAARVFSLLMQVMMIAPILAPVLGGYVLELSGWRGIFWTLAGLGLLGLLWSVQSVPETLPTARRVPLALGNIVRSYSRQLRLPTFMRYTIGSGFVMGALFAYLSGAAFVFTQHFGLTPVQFSYLFAANAIGLVVAGQINNRLLRAGWPEQRTLLVGLVVHLGAAFALWALVQLGLASLPVYLGLLALSIGALGLVFGNITALTMAHGGEQAGVASALMGMLQYLMAAIIGYIASLAAPGPGPLPLTLALCGVAAVLCCLWAGRSAPR